MRWLTELFKNTAFTALVSAIAGSVVGSVTGYLYNKRLEERKSNADHWVKRKESIYSPLYTQALSLKEYLEKISDYPRPLANIAIIEGRAYSNQVLDFTLWYSVKRDTRYDYIPDNIKKDLDNVYKAVEDRDNNEEAIFVEINQLAAKFLATNQQLFDEAKTKDNNMSASLGIFIGNVILPYQSNADTSVSVITSSLNMWLRQDTDPQLFQTKCENLIEQARKLKSFQNMMPVLNDLQKKCDVVVADLRKLITKIIEDYEGGVNIKL